MDDLRIIELYFGRDEQAIKETDVKYGKLCHSIAYNILNNHEDSEECVNDTYVGVWNAIPPTRPNNFMSFVCRIARNLSLKQLEFMKREKRSADVLLSLDELASVLPDERYAPDVSDEDVGKLISRFLRTQKNGFNAKNLYDVAEQEESERNIVTIIRVFSYGFIVLISLIAAANVFNTISTNISLRRREFAMLKSVGMTQKGFNKMMNFECLLYGSRALLYGLPVSCGVTYLIYLAVMEGMETKFHLPWTAIGIATLSVFLVVFVTMMYSMSKIKKDNPIDALKNENL